MVLSPLAPKVYKNCDLRLFWLASAALLSFSGQQARSQEKSGVRDKVAKSIVPAIWEGSEPVSAICVKKDGWFICVVPAAAATAKSRKLALAIDGEEKETEILATDSTTGLCLVRVKEGEIEPLAIRKTEPQPGAEIVPGKKGRARLAGKDREYLGETLPVSLLRIHLDSAAKDHIGEPLFCAEGTIAGLVTARELQNQNEAHAIPAARISKFLEDYELNKETGDIRLGASFHKQSTIPEILKIRPDSPAEKAGLQPGDVILKIGGETVKSLPELAGICENLPAGQEVTLEVLRNLRTVECKIVPQLAPEKTDPQ